MEIRNFEIFEIHADYCRALASPKRLAILACLDKKEMSVGELSEVLKAPISTISRHLSVMKNKHLVTSRHDGNRVYYIPSDPRIVNACALIRTVLIDSLKRRGELALEINPEEIIVDE